jgi:hypothetical protein
VIYLLEIHRWVDIEELDQPVEHLFTQNLSLLIEAFLVFPDREADDGVLAHEEVFTVRAGDETALLAVSPATAAILFKFGEFHFFEFSTK